MLWTPHFGSCVSHSKASSIFIFEKMIYWLFENDLESPLIFVLFLKGKQNKKEKPQVWLLTLEKVVCEKPDRVRGSGYL